VCARERGNDEQCRCERVKKGSREGVVFAEVSRCDFGWLMEPHGRTTGESHERVCLAKQPRRWRVPVIPVSLRWSRPINYAACRGIDGNARDVEPEFVRHHALASRAYSAPPCLGHADVSGASLDPRDGRRGRAVIAAPGEPRCTRASAYVIAGHFQVRPERFHLTRDRMKLTSRAIISTDPRPPACHAGGRGSSPAGPAKFRFAHRRLAAFVARRKEARS